MKAVMKTVTIAVVAATAMISANAAMAEGERYVLVSHAPDSDSWWNTIKNGLALGGEQMGVTVEYRNPPTGDLADMARIIEQAAASRIFGLLPPDQAQDLRALWDEFEAAETADAIFAKSIDRVQPVIANLETGGGTWPAYGVTAAQLETRVGAKVARGAPALWSALKHRIDAWFAARASSLE